MGKSKQKRVAKAEHLGPAPIVLPETKGPRTPPPDVQLGKRAVRDIMVGDWILNNGIPYEITGWILIGKGYVEITVEEQWTFEVHLNAQIEDVGHLVTGATTNLRGLK